MDEHILAYIAQNFDTDEPVFWKIYGIACECRGDAFLFQRLVLTRLSITDVKVDKLLTFVHRCVSKPCVFSDEYRSKYSSRTLFVQTHAQVVDAILSLSISEQDFSFFFLKTREKFHGSYFFMLMKIAISTHVNNLDDVNSKLGDVLRTYLQLAKLEQRALEDSITKSLSNYK